MTTEPTNIQLDNIEAEDIPDIEFADMVIYLENGVSLLSRVILNVKAEDGERQEDVDSYMLLFRPARIFNTNDGNVIIQPWILESDDEYYPIERYRILTTATPRTEMLQYYREAIGVSDKKQSTETPTLH